MAETTLKACFEKAAQKAAAKPALVFLRGGRWERCLTYRDLHQEADRVAHALAARGLRKGDRVIFTLEKCLFHVVAHLACQKMGIIAVPLNPGFKKAEMAYFLEDSQPALVFAGPAQARLVQAIDPRQAVIEVDPQRPHEPLEFYRGAPARAPEVEILAQDLGLIIYTSGTTGQPKGAVLTQRNLTHDALNVIRIWEIAASDVICHALPLFHVHGLCFALHTALMAGATVLMLDRFEPSTVLEVLSRRGGEAVCTVFMAVPSMYAKMLSALGDRRMDFSHMRLWTSGSAPLLVQDFRRIRDAFGLEPVEREGMTETGMNFSNPIHGPRKPGSIGIPLPELDVRVVDPETLQDVPRGQVGELWLRGPGVTPGYWRKPAETARAFEGGWFRTGDLGRVDEEGYYYLTDRIKHIIISGGENISPKEIESVINQMQGVDESSVVGVPDEKWGEKVVAAVVPRPGARLRPEEIAAFCKARLHDWKCPKEIRLVPELPKNTMGKVLKEEVKALFGVPGGSRLNPSKGRR